MILIYPMLVSSTVSMNALPVIAKALERYIIIYRYDALLQSVNRMGQKQGWEGRFKVKGGKIVQEIVDYSMLNEALPPAYSRDEQGELKGNAAPPQTATYASSTAHLDSRQMDMKSLSLEPTWISVTVNAQTAAPGSTDTGGYAGKSVLIGVKVLPVRAKSDTALSNILLYDRNVKGIEKLLLKMGRSVMRLLFRIWSKTWFGKKKEVAYGDAKKDIIYNRTVYYDPMQKSRSRIFVCVSANDVDDDFFQKAGGILKLFKMGWNSIIVVDDVNRVAHFCVTEYRGQCSSVPMSALYGSFQAMEVFNSLDDARRSSGALFKFNTPVSKITENSLADKKLNKYRGY